MAYDYDLFVIGGGSGGVRAARVAWDRAGKRVALAEMSKYGGTCVQRGCVPKKLMVFASNYPPQVEDARSYGWDIEDHGRFNWDRFKARLTDELKRLEGVYAGLLDGSDVTRYEARATLKDAHTIELSTGETVTADQILLAVGGHPVRPPIKGADLGLVSDDMFELERIPEKLLIVGGGYIACEFAGIMNGLGSDVCVWHRGAQILRGFDDEARGLIAEGMRHRGIDLSLGTAILEMRRTADGKVWAKATNGDEAEFDAVLLATGRAPNTDGMGLEDAGVALARNGAVKVDEHGRTNVPNIWALGDVIDEVQLTPVAIREAMAFVATCFEDTPTPYDHEMIPSAVFTQPEMGSVGMTEEEAIQKDVSAEIYATSFRPMQTAFAGRAERALMKMVVHAETRGVLGVHIVSPGAGDMIQFAGIAVKSGLTKEQFDATCAVHPTVAEEMVTMKTPVRRT
ncbi:MAG: glutathione-disulfide reductase [Shimia sp.]